LNSVFDWQNDWQPLMYMYVDNGWIVFLIDIWLNFIICTLITKNIHSLICILTMILWRFWLTEWRTDTHAHFCIWRGRTHVQSATYHERQSGHPWPRKLADLFFFCFLVLLYMLLNYLYHSRRIVLPCTLPRWEAIRGL
jgi:hypothetical protein